MAKKEEYKSNSDRIRHKCLTVYLNGINFRAIGRVEEIHYIRELNHLVKVILPNAYDLETIPQVGKTEI